MANDSVSLVSSLVPLKWLFEEEEYKHDGQDRSGAFREIIDSCKQCVQHEMVVNQLADENGYLIVDLESVFGEFHFDHPSFGLICSRTFKSKWLRENSEKPVLYVPHEHRNHLI